MPVKIDKSCANCKILNNTKKNTCLEIYLCTACSELDEYKLLYKTFIKKQYKINEIDLIGCPKYTKYIGFKSGAVGTLYKKIDVIRVFCQKYNLDLNDKNAINLKLNELSVKKNKQTPKLSNVDKRQILLTNALAKYKLELRADSKLYNGFIDGSVKDWSVDKIVERMCQMKYLFEYCNMEHYQQKAYETQRAERNAGYWPDCTVFEQAEYMALEKYGNYPDIYPWMID